MATLIVLAIGGFIAGVWLGRFNVLAILVATAASGVGLFSYEMLADAILADALLSGVAVALAMQAGYLTSVFMRPAKKL